MRSLKRLRPSPAMILATVALFVALGGAGYAAFSLPNNSVRSATIVNGQVKTADLASSAVNRARIKNNAVNSSKVANGSLEAADLSAPAQAALKGLKGDKGDKGDQGPSNAFSRFRDGNVPIATGGATAIAHLDIPEAGSYVAFAKTILNNDDAANGAFVTCTLTAGTDSDLGQVLLGPDNAAFATAEVLMSNLNVVHTFAAAGAVDLTCNSANNTTNTVFAFSTKITAIKVGSLSNLAQP